MSILPVIIVNYGTALLTIDAVESVLASELHSKTVEVHVVDNASPGDDTDLLTLAAEKGGWGSRVKFYFETENHGFGRANNLVLRKLATLEQTPELVFFLNPDARAQPATLQQLAEFLYQHPSVAIAGCKIVDPESEVEETAAFRFPNATNEFVGAVQVGMLSRFFSSSRVSIGKNLNTSKVDWVSGAAFMARFDPLHQLDFFDDEYFLYFEEVDLMKRLTRHGWDIWHVAETTVEHFGGVATGVNNNKASRRRFPGYWYDSWRIYMTKNHGFVYSRLCGVLKLTGWIISASYRGVLGRDSNVPKNYLSDFWRHALGPMFGISKRKRDAR